MVDTSPSWLAIVNTPFIRFMKFLLPLLWIDCVQFFLSWKYIGSTAIVLTSWALGTLTLGVLALHQQKDALYASEYRRAVFFEDSSYSSDTNIQCYRTYILFIKDFPYNLILLTECTVVLYIFLFVVTCASVQRWPQGLPTCLLVSVIVHFVCASNVTIVWVFFMIKRYRFYHIYSSYFPGATAVERAYVQSLLSTIATDASPSISYSIDPLTESTDVQNDQTSHTQTQEREQTRVLTDDADLSSVPLIDLSSSSSSSSSVGFSRNLYYEEEKKG